MKRRQFLKSIFGVAAGLVVVPSVVKAKSKVFIYGTTKDFIEVGEPLGTRKNGMIYVKAAEDIKVGDFTMYCNPEYHPIFSPLIKRTKELLREQGIEIPKELN